MRRDKHAYETRDELLVTEKIEAVSAKLEYLPDFLVLRDTYVDQMLSCVCCLAKESVGLSGSLVSRWLTLENAC